MNIGGSELIVVFLLALIFFGPKKLPEIGRSIGEAMRELRRMSNEVTSAFEEAMDDRGKYSSSSSSEWDHPNDGGLAGTSDSGALPVEGDEKSESEYDPYNEDPYAGHANIEDEAVAAEASDPDDAVQGHSQNDLAPEELSSTERTRES